MASDVHGEGPDNMIVWNPSDDVTSRSRLLRFINEQGLADYDALLERAVREPSWYWDAVVKHLGIEWYEPYDQVLDLSGGLPWPKWFTGAKYNYVHDAVDKWASGPERERTAIIWEGDGGGQRQLTFGEVARETNRLAGALRALGVEKGDRVGIFLPMVPETAIATLACGKIGAIFVPIFSGYGGDAAATRLRDCETKLLITATVSPGAARSSR